MKQTLQDILDNEPIEAELSSMAIMIPYDSKEHEPGDIRIEWDRSDPESVAAARETFTRWRAKGYMAYTLNKDGRTGGTLLTQFDPTLKRIVFTPPMQGGSSPAQAHIPDFFSLPIFRDLAKAFEAVPQERIAYMDTKLDKLREKDTTLGIITNPATKRMLATVSELKTAHLEAIIQHRRALTTEDEKRWDNESDRLKKLVDVASAIFWASVNAELDAWSSDDMGIRENWMVVKARPEVLERLEDALDKMGIQTQQPGQDN